MPTGNTPIDRYTYRLIPGSDGADVVIHLYDERSNLVATVLAVPDDSPVPAAEERGRRHVLYYRRSVVPDVIDMLRNEGPIYLVWGDEVETALATGYEPVGEAELAPLRRRKH